MNGRYYLIFAAGIVLSFVGGFLIANSINRREISDLRTENDRLRAESAVSGESPDDLTLTDNEIRTSIEKADQDPGNSVLQKNLGFALYRYGVIKTDPLLLTESVRLLERTHKLLPGDYDVLVGLGNAHFDIGYFKKDNASLALAREYYLKAISRKPEDLDVRTDLGISYFLAVPPDDKNAVNEFQKVLSRDPKHQKALEFLVQSLTRQGNTDAARKYQERLGEIASGGNQTIAPSTTTPGTNPSAEK